MALSIGTSPLTLVVCATLMGIGVGLGSQSRVFLLQTIVPEQMRGQGFSFSAVLLYAGDLLSLALFGWLSTYLPLNVLFTSAGGGMFLISGTVLLWQIIVQKAERRKLMEAISEPKMRRY